VRITRRGFIIGVGAATTGLALGLERTAFAADHWKANAFIQIGSDGSISIVCSRSEMGQGIRSSMPILIADELGADPAAITIIQGDGDVAYGEQDTDGSSSIRGHIWDDVRPLAATARQILAIRSALALDGAAVPPPFVAATPRARFMLDPRTARRCQTRLM